MASYIKRGDSYRIKVNTKEKGYQYLNWKPDENIKNNPKKVQKELKRQMVLFEEKCKNGHKACNIKFSDFVENDWLINYAKKEYSPSTYDKMLTNVKRVNAEIGDMRLDKITKSVLTRMKQRFEQGTQKFGRKPLNAKTICNTLSYVSTVFNYAKELEIVETNPCDDVKKPSVKQTEKEYYSIEDTNKLFDEFNLKAPILYHTFYILALYSGLRLGELCGLRWEDINFENNIIFIKRTAYKATNLKEEPVHPINSDDKRIEKSPKTKSSIRYIKLPQIVFDYLNQLKKHYKSEQKRLGTAWNTKDEKIVFRNYIGKAVSPNAMTLWLDKFCKRNNLKHICTHDLRHLNASLLIKNGCDVKTVQQNLGHAQASTTLNIYAYAFMEKNATISECISDCIKVG